MQELARSNIRSGAGFQNCRIIQREIHRLQSHSGPPQRFIDLVTELYYRYGPALSASLMLLPVVLLDVIRVSNRFVGPVKRLRQGLADVADGRPAQPLNFRDSDFWCDLANNFNRAAARVAAGAVARQLLARFGIELASHVTAIGSAHIGSAVESAHEIVA